MMAAVAVDATQVPAHEKTVIISLFTPGQFTDVDVMCCDVFTDGVLRI